MSIARLTILLLMLLLPMLPFSVDAADTLDVVVTQSILADVTQNIVGEHAQVVSIIPRGADPHGFVPTPADLALVSEADIVFINGAGYEESLLDAVQGAGESVNIVSASACILIRPFASAHEDMHEDEHGEADEHGHEDEHAHEDEHEDEHADEDDHMHEDEHEGEHADEDDHMHEDEHEGEHADEDDHMHEDEHEDEHADEDEHAHEDEHEDEHAHEDEHGESHCDDHDMEVASIVGDAANDRGTYEVLGREEDVDCAAGHGHHDDHGHGHGAAGCDPHFWLDSHNVIYWTLMIRDSLSETDPDRADDFAANADDYIAELLALEADFIAPALAQLPSENRILVASHESLGYLASTYGFDVMTTVVAGILTTVEPSARDVAALIDLLNDEGVPAIFTDEMSSDSIMMAIADETGVSLVALLADSLSEDDGPASNYLDYMRFTVSTIVDALKPAS